MSKIAAVLSFIVLAGCALASDPVITTGACPVPVKYDQAFLDALADQIEESVPEGSPLERAISDYIVLRAQAKACLEG